MKLLSVCERGFFIGAMVVGMVGCGEDFQGTFVGSNIEVYNPTNAAEQSCSLDTGSNYEIEVQTQVSGDSIELTITSLHRPGQTTSEAAKVLTGYAISSGLSGSTTFQVENAHFSNSRQVGDRIESASVSGRLSPARDTLDNFVWNYSGFFNNSTTPCSLGVRGTNLVRR